MHCIYIVRSLCFKIFSASFLITFLSPGIALSINMHVPFSLSRIIMSGLLLGIVLSVCTCCFHSIVTLPPWVVTTEFGTCSYQCFLSSCTHISLNMLKCICALTTSLSPLCYSRSIKWKLKTRFFKIHFNIIIPYTHIHTVWYRLLMLSYATPTAHRCTQSHLTFLSSSLKELEPLSSHYKTKAFSFPLHTHM